MAIVISGNGIDMGGNPVSNASQVDSSLINASQIDSTVINENGDNVATTSNLVGFKNYIINGGFDIWQRGTPITPSVGYKADRWYTGNSSRTYSQSTDVPSGKGFAYSLLMSDNNYSGQIEQRIELPAIGNAGVFQVGRTFTLSFWAKSSDSTPIYFTLAFANGGTNSSALAELPSINTNTSWQKFSITFTITGSVGVSDNNVRLIFNSNYYGTRNITGVQLEEGSVATPFEQRPIGLELSLCQRYYQRFVRNGNSGELCSHERVQSSTAVVYVTNAIPFKVPMRTSPSVIIPRIYEGTTDYATGWNVYGSGLNGGMGGIAIYKTIPNLFSNIIAFDAIADAEL